MTPEEVSNLAKDSASVGFQGTVHGGHVTIYQVGPDADPKTVYEAAVHYLDGGMPAEARRLIDEAVSRGHSGAEVGFHWILALLSGRTRKQLSDTDITALREAPHRFHAVGDDMWTEGLRMIRRLLTAPDTDADTVAAEFGHLPDALRAKIARHLDLFLTGPLKDRLWDQAVERARKGVRAGDRSGRVWKFFQPEPIPPRLRPTAPPPAQTWRTGTLVAVAAFALAVAGIGAVLVLRPDVRAGLSYIAAILGGCAVAAPAADWRYRTTRTRELDSIYFGRPVPGPPPPKGGFVSQVHRLFAHYFATRYPHGMTSKEWRERVAGIEDLYRTEIGERFREQRIGADRLTWLARFIAQDTKRRWSNGDLFDYRRSLRTPDRVKTSAALALTVFIACATRALAAAVTSKPLPTVVLVLAAILFARTAARGALASIGARRRATEDAAEAAADLQRQRAAFLRWSEVLADRPEDDEMAAWMEHDLVLLLDRLFKHYKLTPGDVLARGVIESGAEGCQRGRVKGGPWRYSRYRLMLFLLTADGVRQIKAEVEMDSGAVFAKERLNYRFDAIASAHLERSRNHRRKFTLRLLDGFVLEVPVTGPEGAPDTSDSFNTNELTVETSGVRTTVHILEGVAAEGKEWISLDQKRGDEQIDLLTDSLAAMTP